MEIRPVRQSDKTQILDFCQNTFSWGDYISEVWNHWNKEGKFLVLLINKTPIAICHSFQNENKVWIEGIRVKKSFRKKGFAKKLVLEIEKIAKKNKCKSSLMLIATNNHNSLRLAKHLKYKKDSKWIFYSVYPEKPKTIPKMKNLPAKNELQDFVLSKGSHYVNSWRWFPLTKSNLKLLISQKKILYSHHNCIIDSVVIFSKSKYFKKTLMLTLIYSTKLGINTVVNYFKNYALVHGIKRVQILTQNSNLTKFNGIEKKYVFYLMKKNL